MGQCMGKPRSGGGKDSPKPMQRNSTTVGGQSDASPARNDQSSSIASPSKVKPNMTPGSTVRTNSGVGKLLRRYVATWH